MTDYTKTTNFTAKDSLPTGNVNKKINGALFDTEFNNIAIANATKANKAGPTFTGMVTVPDLTFNADNPELLGGDTNGTFYISAGATKILGSVLTLYGDTHSTKAGDFEFLDDATAVFTFDASGSLFTATGALTATGAVTGASFKGASGATLTGFADEDNMASNSATLGATQQSIKAYVDAQQDTVDTLAEVLALSNSTGGTNIETTTTDKVQFRDAAIYINSSTDGQLDIVADTEIQIAATTIDINGAINASGEIIAASLVISGNIDLIL